ncbi:transcriptional regulator [uncultured Sphingomonas sp.]|uniref:winged helix-turn-helix domain-containing protein n=1 Tax=uncultured Sphingomonas sp. TaxID=158754 RepID=UPI0035CBA7E8
MASDTFRFDRFVLDPDDRHLRRDGVPVEINARYLDALALLVREAGKLVSKDRFLNEVWRGVPVTDEALTQCIRTLRRQLGDDAASPHFIETVPKHGYRFIAPVDRMEEAERTEGAIAAEPSPAMLSPWRDVLLLGGAGTIGAGFAGIVGGLFYGFAGAAHPLGSATGGASILLVLLWLTIAAALMGGAGVSFGIAAAILAPARPWMIVGGAMGGLIVGGAVKLLGLDAFNLLLGRSPDGITGAPEGMLLGAAVGLGAWLANCGGDTRSLRRNVTAAAAAGSAGAIFILLLGGRLMGGSVDQLARAFPGSRLRVDAIGGLFGEAGFGPVAQVVTGGLEGGLFGGFIVGAMVLARRRL